MREKTICFVTILVSVTLSIVMLSMVGVMLYGLFMLDGQRKVNAEGYLLLTPDGRAAELRSGGGARVLAAGSRPPRG